MEARNRTLPDWFTRLRTRQLVLPRFQRFEAWTHNQITSLLDTVLKDLPSGALLTLDISGKEPFVSRAIAGAPSKGENVAEHLLDGQQRITALWRSLNDNYSERTYYVQLGPDKDTGEPYYAVSEARWEKEGKRFPLWADDPLELWRRKMLPVSLMLPGQHAENRIKEWSRIASGGEAEIMIDIIQKINTLRGVFASYNIPFLSLPSSTDRETALDVFIRMNTSASPLSDYDIVVAQVEAATEISMHDFVDFLVEKTPTIRNYGDAADMALGVSALLQDRTPTKGSYLHSDFPKSMIDNWGLVEVGVHRAIRFLEEEGIYDSKRLPSDVVLNPLAALWAEVQDGLDAEGKARTMLRKFLWRAIFTERYDRTSATRALVDYRALRKLLKGNGDDPPLFDENQYQLPSAEILKTAAWPTRKDSMARGVLALSLRLGAQDFADAAPISRNSLENREYHHLFPKTWLKVSGFSELSADLALNCALVTWKTNRSMSNKAPSDYMNERFKAASLGPEEIEGRLRTHLIPKEELLSDRYDDFLSRRASMIHDLMVRVCNGHSS